MIKDRYLSVSEMEKLIDSEIYWSESTKASVKNVLRHVPSADVVPVVHGRWEDCSNGWMCSVCSRDSTHNTAYCPYCGAKMDKEAPKYEDD